MDRTRALTDLDDLALVELVLGLGGRRFQARQVSHWLYRHRALDHAELHNLPQQLRQRLGSVAPLVGSRIAAVAAAGDGTRKLLIELHDGERIEAVLIPEGARLTLCVSTQVGCPVACVFCASGLYGVRRNLLAGEIVEQLLLARSLIDAEDRITHVVVMGMGEPLLNLPHLLPALQRLTDADGIGLGARRITVSTSGYPQRIAELARQPKSYNLAISLHAADDALRRRLVPTASAPVAELVEAARGYLRRKGRQVTFEVVLLAGQNDRQEHAQALVEALAGLNCCVNLIPWNRVDEIPDLQAPTPAAVNRFTAWLRAGGLNVTVRQRRGAERDAACGQLRIRDARGS